jgi:hypothetical protein
VGLAVTVTTTPAQLLPVLAAVLLVPVKNLPLFTPGRLRAPVPCLSALLDGTQRGALAGPQAGGRYRVCRRQLDIRAGAADRWGIAEVCPAERVSPPVDRIRLSDRDGGAVEQARGEKDGTRYWCHLTI